MIKNFKALDNIRNTQAGHIKIDYRIACSMINFNHKPTCPDKDETLKIAKKLKEKASIEINSLKNLLKKQVGTKEIFSIEQEKITDFPKLSPKIFKNNIFLGSFHLKQSKSYIQDIVKSGKAYLVSEKLLKTIQDSYIEKLNTKILAIELISRHKRGKKKQASNQKVNVYTKDFRNSYKVFIEYIPSLNRYSSIRGK